MKVGDKLSTFTVLEDLGHGGMGGVYIGFDARTKQLVAIKTLFSEFAKDEAYVRRFQREAEIYRKLSHPNIVSFCDAGFENGVYFIAMEHVKGKALDHILKEVGKLPLDHAVKIMGHLVDGIAHAHEKGVVHRDIKPQNIMIREDDGAVKILDFGIAQTDDNLVKTVTGSILGTFFYSSPEQNQGKKIDERSDLYSLGLVFYEMLTGERALRGNTLLEVTAYQMRSQLPAPSVVNPDIPPPLDKLVMKMLEKDPNKRFESANDVTKALQGFKDKGSFDSGGGFDDEELQENWKRAEEALLTRNYDKALEYANRVYEHKKDDASVLMMLGKIYAGKKIMGQAMDFLRRGTALDPENQAYVLDHAIALFNLGVYKDAKVKLKQYLEFDSDNLYAKNYLNRIKEFEDKQRKEEEEAAIAKLKAMKKANEKGAP